MVSGILKRLAPGIGRSVAGSEPAGSISSIPAHSQRKPRALSLDEVYANHFRYVWRCVRGLGVPQDAVDDACHEIFLVVARKLHEFDGERAELTTWLYAIALRVSSRCRAQARRDRERRVELGSLGNEAGSSAAWIAPSAESDLSDRLSLAWRALDALDVVKRTVFVLAFVEQRTAPEIAQMTSVPLNTVYSRMRAARREFEAEVARINQSHPGDLHETASS
jgi:RNA polymerase sigma-70 factor (ECF subfamily)